VSTPVAPAGLAASHTGASTTLRWTTDSSAVSYKVYQADGGAGKFSTFPSGWTIIGSVSPGVGTTSFSVADGANNTYTTYSSFVITASDGSTKGAASSVATRVNFYFKNTAGTKNIYRPSLPYVGQYANVNGIVSELTQFKTDIVAKWDVTNQAYDAYSYYSGFGTWIGNNWVNDAGTAASYGFMLHALTSFNWVVVGTDNNPALNFTANIAKANSNLRQMPYSGIYAKASDIVTDIEGGIGPGTNTKVYMIAFWDAVAQTYSVYLYNNIFATWSGDNFTVLPGSEINFYVSSGASFTWSPKTVVK
jgi:hypothetical protein